VNISVHICFALATGCAYALYIYMYICMYVCVDVYVCMYVYLYICMYACTCICVYAWMYTYVYVFEIAVYTGTRANRKTEHRQSRIRDVDKDPY